MRKLDKVLELASRPEGVSGQTVIGKTLVSNSVWYLGLQGYKFDYTKNGKFKTYYLRGKGKPIKKVYQPAYQRRTLVEWVTIISIELVVMLVLLNLIAAVANIK